MKEARKGTHENPKFYGGKLRDQNPTCIVNLRLLTNVNRRPFLVCYFGAYHSVTHCSIRVYSMFLYLVYCGVSQPGVRGPLGFRERVPENKKKIEPINFMNMFTSSGTALLLVIRLILTLTVAYSLCALFFLQPLYVLKLFLIQVIGCISLVVRELPKKNSLRSPPKKH